MFQGSWALSQLWVFIVFPLVGGILGAGDLAGSCGPSRTRRPRAESEAVAPAPFGKHE